jgi:RHS repeat-associated protein
VYGPEHQRTKQTRSDGTTIIYAGAQEVEIKAGSGGITTVKTYWPGGIGVEIDRGVAATELDWTYLDRLGSPIAISDQNGVLKEKLAYDAWGKRRNLSDSGTPNTIDGVVDNKGYTGHEMLDQLDLVHMNGRVYDPFIAKFLSADPFVTDPYNGQNYNRYSYVLNNPTNLTDPTGYEWTEYAPVVGSVGDFKEAVGEGRFAMAGVHGVLAITDGLSLGLGTLIKDGVKVLIKAEIKHEAAQQLAKEGGAQAARATEKAAQAAEKAAAKGEEKAAAAESKAATGSERAKNPGKGQEKASGAEKAEKESGSYTNTHESGKTYDGKGGRERSQESGKRVEAETGDKHVATDHTSAPNNREAFKDESRRLDSNGGAKSPDNHNKIESPGKKYRKEDGE